MVSLPDSCSFIRMQSWDAGAAVPQAVQAAVGGRWPQHAGAAVLGEAEALCLGPGDWLVIAGEAARAELLRTMQQACEGTTFRATDVSAALSRIQVEGAQARALLSEGCSLDLHPDAFTVGRSTRTRFAGMAMIIRCLEPQRFECIVARSLRDYCCAWFRRR